MDVDNVEAQRLPRNARAHGHMNRATHRGCGPEPTWRHMYHERIGRAMLALNFPPWQRDTHLALWPISASGISS